MTTGNDENIILDNMEIERAEHYKYLGDEITADGKLDKTIEKRKATITGMTAELNQILEEIDYVNKFRAVIQYYKSIIAAKLLTNSETWNQISGTNIKELEQIQAMTLKRLLRLPQGTPTNGLRNELGILTVKSQINMKKLMFWHRVINMKDHMLVRKIMVEQMEKPGSTWYGGVEKVAEELKLPKEAAILQTISRERWRRMIIEAVKKSENEDLKEWVKNSKKCKDMVPNLELKEYLVELEPEAAMTIMKARLGMTQLKTNYRNMHTDVRCHLCGEEDDMQHLLGCPEENDETEEKWTTQEIKSTIFILAENPKSHNQKLKNLAYSIIQKLKNRSVS